MWIAFSCLRCSLLNLSYNADRLQRKAICAGC